MIFVGIDPGIKGGIAVIDNRIDDGGYGAVPMPKTRAGICQFLALQQKSGGGESVIVAIESVHSMPGQGVSSSFKFGKGYGEILGICCALGFIILEPTPQAWKKLMLAGTDRSKDAAIQVAENLFPEINLVPSGCRVPSDGMAEALLMAEWARRTYVF